MPLVASPVTPLVTPPVTRLSLAAATLVVKEADPAPPRIVPQPQAESHGERHECFC